MKSNLNFYYLLILSNILELSKFVCQVPQISGRFPSSLASFSRICQSTSCGNCQKKLVTLGCLSGISLDYCESIFFLAPLCNYLLLMAVSLETNQRILFCSDTHEDHKQCKQWKKSCFMKIGTYQSKKSFINYVITPKESKVSFNFQFCNLSWFTYLFDFVTATVINVILFMHSEIDFYINNCFKIFVSKQMYSNFLINICVELEYLDSINKL